MSYASLDVKGYLALCSFQGANLNHHKIQSATISWGGKLHGRDPLKHWSFDPQGEDAAMRLDNMRTFPGIDSSREWHQPRAFDYGLSARVMDAITRTLQNRSQKRDYESGYVTTRAD